MRTGKTTLAAVLSFVAAEQLGTSQAPVLAPLTALLVVQLTMYQTVSSGLQRIVSVLAGVLLAVGLATLVGLTWWSLGLAVAVSLVVGRLLRLGSNLLEVPISAMIVLAVGGNSTLAAGRVYETLIGAAVGVAVNAVVAPPLYVQPADDALADLADAMARVVRGLGDDLRGPWSRDAADRWLARARGLATEVARADRTLAEAEESARFNPRGVRARSAQPQLRSTLSGLEHGYVALRSLCRALLDRTWFVPEEEPEAAYPPAARDALADLLEQVGEGFRAAVVAARTGGSEPREGVATRLSALRAGREQLSALLVVDPTVDPAAWQQHGALLASVDRLRTEVEATSAPTDAVWHPPALAERQRRALRRALSARRDRR